MRRPLGQSHVPRQSRYRAVRARVLHDLAASLVREILTAVMWYSSLTSNNLRGTIPSSIGFLGSLTSLYVASSFVSPPSHRSHSPMLRPVPHTHTRTHRLLGSNALSGTLPTSIGFLANLQGLYVGPRSPACALSLQSIVEYH